MEKILIINPGSTSTKLAVWEEKEGMILEEDIEHSLEKLSGFKKIVDQLEYRTECIREFLENKGLRVEEFTALAARGGLLRPLAGGTYEVNEDMVRDLRRGVQGEHASNLAALIAGELGKSKNLPVYITDPVSVDEFNPLARYSGIREVERRSLGHALNIKAVGRKVAAKIGRDFSAMNMVVAHLGGGFSIASVKRGRIEDVNNANEMGPFSPERTGGLPVGDLVTEAFSGKYTQDELRRKLIRKGGLVAYLGTNSCQEVEERIAKDDEEAKLVYEAMIYQICKEIGAAAAALAGKVHIIVITGGLARSHYVVERIKEKVSFIANVLVFPGSLEMEALALGAYRVRTGQEEACRY